MTTTTILWTYYWYNQSLERYHRSEDNALQSAQRLIRLHEADNNFGQPIIQQEHPQLSIDLSIWANTLARLPMSWTEITTQCLNILNESKRNNNDNDFVAASCMFQLPPRLTKGFDDNMCEDSFVHMYLDGLLDGIFSTEVSLKQDW
ncbi:hypothetical protein DM01DRAFT_1348133 [Hesseltinella vesiculosa]|uniref:Uncharacterized protein n=1 Tax=Hesseltinella vesiculosa TaxID=101127 RepID=A0A1X2G9D7_9FUNG|nr:hypothetical protein DM01DRAFT_1348133 [Hesseltinella vesiculosa]